MERCRVVHLVISLPSPGLLRSPQGAVVRERGQSHLDRHLPMTPVRTKPAFAPPSRGSRVVCNTSHDAR